MGNVDLSVNFAGLRLKNPILTASGTCGYIDELADFFDINSLGGFITKSISPKPRKGNPVPRIVETDSGMLNAIGLANIGLKKFIAEKIPIIERFSVPVFVNLAGETIDDYVEVADELSSQKAVSGFELNISCPNVKEGGISFGTNPSQVRRITEAVKAVCGKKPLIVKLTPTVTDISVTAAAAVEGGADSLSLVNTFTAMVIDTRQKKTVLANRTGGLSGPAIKPIAVYLVNKVYNDVAKRASIPLIGLGGIRTAEDVVEFMIAGASVVSVGTASFAQPEICGRLVNELARYCKEENITEISSLTGNLSG